MRLVYKTSRDPVAVGDHVTVSGQPFTVDYFREPHKPDSEGKVTLLAAGAERPHGTEFYVSVIGAEWIEREDRRESPTGEDVWPSTDRTPQDGPWRVEPAGVPAERSYFAMRRLASGALEFMRDESGDPKDFPSDAAAQAAVTIANAKIAAERA